LEKTLPRGSADAFGALRIERMSVKDEPLEAVLRQLADRLKFELRIDETAVADARVSLRQRISVTAEHVSLDELLGKLLQSTGLTFRRAGKVVEITPEG
jgi:type II secretory pathway component HofQ